MKNGKNLALFGAAAVIAYLIYLYEKKKTAVASRITGFEATSTPTGAPISAASASTTDAILSGPTVLPLSLTGPSEASLSGLAPNVSSGNQPSDLNPISILPLTMNWGGSSYASLGFPSLGGVA